LKVDKNNGYSCLILPTIGSNNKLENFERNGQAKAIVSNRPEGRPAKNRGTPEQGRPIAAAISELLCNSE